MDASFGNVTKHDAWVYINTVKDTLPEKIEDVLLVLSDYKTGRFDHVVLHLFLS